MPCSSGGQRTVSKHEPATGHAPCFPVTRAGKGGATVCLLPHRLVADLRPLVRAGSEFGEVLHKAKHLQETSRVSLEGSLAPVHNNWRRREHPAVVLHPPHFSLCSERCVRAPCSPFYLGTARYRSNCNESENRPCWRSRR